MREIASLALIEREVALATKSIRQANKGLAVKPVVQRNWSLQETEHGFRLVIYYRDGEGASLSYSVLL